MQKCNWCTLLRIISWKYLSVKFLFKCLSRNKKKLRKCAIPLRFLITRVSILVLKICFWALWSRYHFNYIFRYKRSKSGSLSVSMFMAEMHSNKLKHKDFDKDSEPLRLTKLKKIHPKFTWDRSPYTLKYWNFILSPKTYFIYETVRVLILLLLFIRKLKTISFRKTFMNP